MKWLLPDAARLDVKTTTPGRVRFLYEEDFSDPAIVKRTAEMARAALGCLPDDLSVIESEDGKTVGIGGDVSRETFGNMMTTEFMMWGSLADRTLRDLMMSPFAAAFAPPANDNGTAHELQAEAPLEPMPLRKPTLSRRVRK